MARKNYGTTLEEDLIINLKIQAIKEKKDANDILEELLVEYFKKKGVKIDWKAKEAQ